MKVLVVGGGGREHALCWKLARSPQVEQVYVAPGNAGCAAVAERVPIQPSQVDALTDFVHGRGIDLTVVGPELPLCLGLADRLRKLGHKVFGPGKEAARLEGSKSFAKSLARRHNIPGPDFKVFTGESAAIAYLERIKDDEFPLVVKADGLAAGKGVSVCSTRGDAMRHVRDCRKRFGEAGQTIVIEEFVRGTEVSVQVVTDGETLLVLDPAQDYKAAHDGGLGPNTGGMGAYSPRPVDSEVMGRIEEKILVPTVHALAREGQEFRGVLYAGLMLTQTGPRLLEYNVRFGDPETQPTLLRLRSDLAELMLRTCEGTLGEAVVEWDPRPAVTVILASEGYPGSYAKGREITGIEAAEALGDVVVFHAGTERRAGKLVTHGGRVLCVTALGDTVSAARERAYEAARCIHFEGMVYRTDIAAEA
ncbi:MAG: phosphoribosylamine--glycine ligase [Planctomycetota bacterium]|nr:MAG: phosphoribosylamine--glycine ligase [Planctomycetota bacterium]